MKLVRGRGSWLEQMQAGVSFRIVYIYSNDAKITCLVGEFTQQRSLAGLAQGLVLSTHVGQFTSTCHSSFRKTDSVLGSLQILHECDGYKYMQAKHAYAS